MADWQPNPQELQQLVLLLQQSQSNSNEVQQEIYKKLDQFAQVPDYNNYLVVIFSKYDHEGTRIKAAILLKNNILSHYKNFNTQAQNFIKNVTLQAIGDNSIEIRKHAAVILSSTAKAIGLESWQEILTILYNLLDSPDPNLLDGSLRTLSEISDDCGYQLTRHKVYEKFTENLVPKLINFFLHPQPSTRKLAVTCLYSLIRYNVGIIMPNFPLLVTNCIQLSKDQDPVTRKSICSIFGVLVSSAKEAVLGHLQEILKLLVFLLNDVDPTVVMEASDFWVQILDQRDCSHYVEIIYPFLPELVPILLKNLIFSEDERITMEADELQRNSTVDQQKDVKPRNFSSSSKTFDEYEGDDEYDDDDDDDDGDYGDEDPQEWTVRKCSGCALDYLAVLLGENLLPIFLPEIEKIMAIQNAPWYVSESVILALGAVADGCNRGLIQYLPQLVPYLIINLSHPVSFIRRITCWTVSRYAHWITSQPHQTYFLPVLENLLRLILDPSKLVQQAAISSISSILEDTSVNVLPYISPILTTFSQAFSIYQLNNLLLLYDAIGTLCDVNKDMKKDPATIALFCQLIMPNLMEKWRTTENTDKTICTLCECLTSVSIALGLGFQPYAESVFQRCLSIIDRYITVSAVEDFGSSENDFIICPLDLLSGISEGLGSSMESLVSSSNLLGILFHCAKQPYGDIRQVTYSLIGDLTKSSIIHMDKALVPFAEEMIKEDPNQNGPATNNASWAIGEMIFNGRERMAPIISNILEWLIKIINSQKLKKSLLENTAVSLGRLCFVFPDIAATRLQEFASNWSYALIYLRPSKEKECAYRGLCIVITKNPTAIFNNNLIMVFRSIANYGETPSAELGSMFQQIIDHFKQLTPPAHWSELIVQLKDSADILQQLYKIRDQAILPQ